MQVVEARNGRSFEMSSIFDIKWHRPPAAAMEAHQYRSFPAIRLRHSHKYTLTALLPYLGHSFSQLWE